MSVGWWIAVQFSGNWKKRPNDPERSQYCLEGSYCQWSWWLQICLSVKRVFLAFFMAICELWNVSIEDVKGQVYVFHFPPNCTAIHQQMDRGVVEAWKPCFRDKFVHAILEDVETTVVRRRDAQCLMRVKKGLTRICLIGINRRMAVVCAVSACVHLCGECVIECVYVENVLCVMRVCCKWRISVWVSECPEWEGWCWRHAYECKVNSSVFCNPDAKVQTLELHGGGIHRGLRSNCERIKMNDYVQYLRSFFERTWTITSKLNIRTMNVIIRHLRSSFERCVNDYVLLYFRNFHVTERIRSLNTFRLWTYVNVIVHS